MIKIETYTVVEAVHAFIREQVKRFAVWFVAKKTLDIHGIVNDRAVRITVDSQTDSSRVASTVRTDVVATIVHLFFVVVVDVLLVFLLLFTVLVITAVVVIVLLLLLVVVAGSSVFLVVLVDGPLVVALVLDFNTSQKVLQLSSVGKRLLVVVVSVLALLVLLVGHVVLVLKLSLIHI